MRTFSFEKAFDFARFAHYGQRYIHVDGDEPYINHPLRVSHAVSEDAKVVAILHDCLEDYGILPPGLSEDDRDAIAYLTRDKNKESYEEYILRILNAPGRAGDIAREVKIADLRDNLSHVGPGHFQDKKVLYDQALMLLATKA